MTLPGCFTKMRFLFLILLSLTLPSFAFAIDPPKEPILRIETGMHTATINRIDVDRSGRWLVSASDDKSVRVWDLDSVVASGRSPMQGMQPVQILRPPIGEADEGMLFSVAISPDGSLVAAGGWTHIGSDAGVTLYLFSRADGRLLGRAGGLSNVIKHLAFSPDGRYLAVTLGAGSGLRLFALSPLRLIAQDTGYGSQSNGAHFSADGERLVTSCYDGYLRLYDLETLSRKPENSQIKNLTPVANQKAPGGNQPFSVKFSPDGAKIAVGFSDTTKINLLSARNLSLMYAPDTGGVTNGNLISVAWSRDGAALYAGGQGFINGAKCIRRWSVSGRGGYRDLKSGATNTIMDLAPLPDGGVAFGGGGPFLGILAQDGVQRLLIAPVLADFRPSAKALEQFKLSQDGSTLQFFYDANEGKYAAFSLTSRSLAHPPGSLPLTPPDTRSLAISGWENTTNPTINNQPIKLNQYERSRSLAIAPNGSRFLLGTSWKLRYFSRSGEQLWVKVVPGVVWGVNIAPNGKVAAAAYGDGTIRWHRLNDGKELLAFFPHADQKRWVLWTPQGYYDASPGGEDLIGWHVNNGKDAAADFFPASQFRASKYRPDLIDRILDTLDEDEALRLVDEAKGRKSSQASIATLLPPVVTITSPNDGSRISSDSVTLAYLLRSPTGDPITNLKLLVDGRPVSQERGLKRIEKSNVEQRITVSIPKRDCEVSLIAENKNGSSVPATIRLNWGGAAPRQDEFVAKPKLYVLSVGVSAYQDKELTLKYAAKDAKDLAAAFLKQKGGIYRDVVTKVLTDSTATKEDVMDGLEWLQKETTSKDVAVLFIAGHGVNDQSGIYYYLPQNANPDKLKRTGVAFSDIKNTLASLAGKALFFVDTCHSGNVMGSRRGTSDITGVVNELSSAENGAIVFASSTGRQYSLEDAKWNNGAFTKALVEGINGKADYSGKGRITINMLDLWLSERVKELTKGQQTPTTTKPQTIQDFPVAVKM